MVNHLRGSSVCIAMTSSRQRTHVLVEGEGNWGARRAGGEWLEGEGGEGYTSMSDCISKFQGVM